MNTLVVILLICLFATNSMNVVLLKLSKSSGNLIVLGVLRMIIVLFALIFVVFNMLHYMTIAIIIYLAVTVYMMGVETNGH